MFKTIEPPQEEPLFLDLPYFQHLKEEDSEFAELRGFDFEYGIGCGTPYPATPLSQRSYDGANPFDDGEPWF